MEFNKLDVSRCTQKNKNIKNKKFQEAHNDVNIDIPLWEDVIGAKWSKPFRLLNPSISNQFKFTSNQFKFTSSAIWKTSSLLVLVPNGDYFTWSVSPSDEDESLVDTIEGSW
ncbi:hypothetical protein VNO77_23223 [Canavalia gladiata]|uniref:Uncharacterized protein n=1 Tax=Canavalia gladiata TaxID=3824 RepID=A0AAN9L6K4_CANGL